MQYLDLSENVAGLISEKGNVWIFLQEGFDEEKMEREHKDATKWTDYNQGVSVIFNFYHGLELLLKGFLVAEDLPAKGHVLSKLLAHVAASNVKADFVKLIAKYIERASLPRTIADFLDESKTDIDQWYQAFKYPEGNDGTIYAHNKLRYQEEKGAEFYRELASDIHEVRVGAVKFAKQAYEGLA